MRDLSPHVPVAEFSNSYFFPFHFTCRAFMYSNLSNKYTSVSTVIRLVVVKRMSARKISGTAGEQDPGAFRGGIIEFFPK